MSRHCDNTNGHNSQMSHSLRRPKCHKFNSSHYESQRNRDPAVIVSPSIIVMVESKCHIIRTLSQNWTYRLHSDLFYTSHDGHVKRKISITALFCYTWAFLISARHLVFYSSQSKFTIKNFNLYISLFFRITFRQRFLCWTADILDNYY